MSSCNCHSDSIRSAPRAESGNDRDSKLIHAIAAGDDAALGEIHSRYARRIESFTLKLTRRRHLAEEAVHETLAAIWLSAPRFRSASKASTWIFGIARIVSVKALRKAGTAVPIATDSQLEALHDPWSNAELCEWLDAALALLPDEQRVALDLRYRLGHSCRQIADSLGCPVNTVKTRMFHGRRKLRRLLPMLAAISPSTRTGPTTPAPRRPQSPASRPPAAR
jgi:RNA polymerase sigma factor (sigma-70 family)